LLLLCFIVLYYEKGGNEGRLMVYMIVCGSNSYEYHSLQSPSSLISGM